MMNALRKFKWGWFFRTAAIIFVVLMSIYLLAVSPLDQYLYDKIILHPLKYPFGFPKDGGVYGVEPEDVYFHADNGKTLHGWFYKAKHERGTVLFCHGNGGTIAQRPGIVEAFLKLDCSVFIFDYQGYGRSEGEPSFPHLFADAKAAYDYVTLERHYQPEQVILFGESLGTIVNADLCSHVRCAGIIEECPLYSIERRGTKLIPALKMFPSWMWAAYGRSTGNVLSQSHVSLLIISGSKDDRAPVADADAFAAEACDPKRYVRIEGAGHSDDAMLHSKEYRQALSQFIDERLGQPANSGTTVLGTAKTPKLK